MELDQIRDLMGRDMEAVDRLIERRLASDIALVNQVSSYIVGSGGKRLRPLMVLTAARACGYNGDKHLDAAAIIEFIHTATLLHDDVVDGSDRRRGRDTVNTVFGNQASVLVGDFLYSRSFEMMVDIGEMRIMDVMAGATNNIAEGEVLQLMNIQDPDTSEACYREVIYRKTARLFEAGAQVAAILSGMNGSREAALVAYGRHLGTAFQLVDDALDYSASAEELGKNIGDDLAEGKPTLPLIYAMQKGTPAEARLIREAIENGGRDQIEAIMRAIESTGALEYTARSAEKEAAAAVGALAELPDSDYKSALEGLARFAVARRH
ncbi:MAG: octaprenyl diphosphate synthase [Gammaproteobacteria bacterium]